YVHPSEIRSIDKIPFLPIQFFKTHMVLSSKETIEVEFKSSGTSGQERSTHYVTDLELYKKSFVNGFKHFYGPINDFAILALLPSYLERQGSSLVYMVDHMISLSTHAESGFFLNDIDKLATVLNELDKNGKRVLLLGVSFALLDLVEKHQFNLKNTIIMETGGMKGRRQELIREDLHKILKSGFDVENIHSEYGMTELLSQAYSKGKGRFQTPPWMKVLTRDSEDPFYILPAGSSGGINIIDLANLHSCAFIATQDLGKIYPDGSFEVLGRFDHSDIRGCNLMTL
ncbi:MAG: acyl transferase, partial [Bacteroidia bacterium]|nr:acyl transferase [Bacteroidia bacterium]